MTTDTLEDGPEVAEKTSSSGAVPNPDPPEPPVRTVPPKRRRGIDPRWLSATAMLIAAPFSLLWMMDPRSSQGLLALLTSLGVYIGPAGWGVLVILKARRQLNREEACLRTIEANGGDILKRLQRNEGGFTVNEDAYRQFLPPNADRDSPTPTSVRMVQNLCNEAIGHRFPPVSATSQFYVGELMHGARGLRTPQAIALRLGIMFTFVGLLSALEEVSKAFGSPGSALEAGTVKLLVEDLTLAFGTSVAGLLAAVSLQAFAELLGSRQRRIARLIEDVAGLLLNVLTRAQTKTAFAASMESLQRSMLQHKEDLNAHQHSVEQAVRESTSQTRASAELFKEQSGALRSIATEQAEHLGRLRAAFQDAAAFETTLAGFLRNQTDQLNGTGAAVSDAVTRVIKEWAATVDARSEAVANAGKVLEHNAERMSEAVDRMVGRLEAEASERQAEQRMVEELRRIADRIDAESDAASMRRTLDILSKSVEGLNAERRRFRRSAILVTAGLALAAVVALVLTTGIVKPEAAALWLGIDLGGSGS